MFLYPQNEAQCFLTQNKHLINIGVNKEQQAQYHGSLEADADVFQIIEGFMEEMIWEPFFEKCKRGLQWSKLWEKIIPANGLI